MGVNTGNKDWVRIVLIIYNNVNKELINITTVILFFTPIASWYFLNFFDSQNETLVDTKFSNF